MQIENNYFPSVVHESEYVFPPEIMIEILSHLRAPEFFNAKLSCRYFCQLTESPCLIKNLFFKHFPKSAKNFHEKESLNDSAYFLRLLQCEARMISGKSEAKKTIFKFEKVNFHGKLIKVEISGNKLIAGFEKIIKILDLKSGKEIDHIFNNKTFSTFFVKDNNIITFSKSGEIVLFDLNKIKIIWIKNIRNLNNYFKVFFKKNKIYIASAFSINILNIKTKKPFVTINFTKPITAIDVRKEKIYTGHKNGIIKIFDSETGKCISVLGNLIKKWEVFTDYHKSEMCHAYLHSEKQKLEASFQGYQNKIPFIKHLYEYKEASLATKADNDLKMYLENVPARPSRHDNAITALKVLKDGTLIGGTSEGIIFTKSMMDKSKMRHWEGFTYFAVSENSLLHSWLIERWEISIHCRRVDEIIEDNGKLIAWSLRDKTVKIWDFQSGKLLNKLKLDGSCKDICYKDRRFAHIADETTVIVREF